MVTTHIGDITYLQFESLANDSLVHFSSTIGGGVSTGAYGSLNLGFYGGDHTAHVFNNRLRLASAVGIPIDTWHIPYQTHEDKIYTIDDEYIALPKEEQTKRLNGIDALITNQVGVCIGVTTADCVPLLIFDPTEKVLAAIHGGWKGTVARIAAKTAMQMKEQFGCDPNNMLAGIAPSISPEVFEVGEEVGATFAAQGFDLTDISFRNPQTGKLHIDLWQANMLQLEGIGMLRKNIEVAGICTYSDSQRFFSARRQSIHSGRMITGGVIRK